VEWQQSESALPDRDFLAFGHHVVFDFAVARLQFRHLAVEELVACLGNERDLVIAIRPSLVFHFQHVWERDPSRSEFWDLILRIQRHPRVPEIGKLIGPELVVSQASSVEDFGPLLQALVAANGADPESAESALHHLVNAFRISVDPGTLLSESTTQTWCELTEVLSQSMTRPVASGVRLLLGHLLATPRDIDRDQLGLLGEAARRLLAFAWASVPRNSWLVNGALTAVCRTFSSAPGASADLLHRALHGPRLEEYGFEEMRIFSSEIKHLWVGDPAFAEELYRVAFGFRELSDEPTDMSGSQIFSVQSTKRQDYELALHRLAEAFPDFILDAPEHAARAMVAILESYAQRKRIDSERETKEIHRILFEEELADLPLPVAIPFEFDGIQAQYASDRSRAWSGAEYHGSRNELRLLAAFETYLLALSADDEQTTLRRRLVSIVAAQARAGFIWKRLLVLGEQAPLTLGRDLRSLAWAVPVLRGADTAEEAGRFLARLFPQLSATERTRVERTVLSLPEGDMSKEQRSRLEQLRDYHLSGLPQDQLVSDNARGVARSLLESRTEREDGGVQDIETRTFGTDPGPPVEPSSARDVGSDPFFKQLRLIEYWASTRSDRVPAGYDVAQIIPTLLAVHNRLASQGLAGTLSAKEAEEAWDILADACVRVVATQGISCSAADAVVATFARDVLIAAAGRAHPTLDPSDDEQFDTEGPVWGDQQLDARLFSASCSC
jgi:hypothetical protein